jgi:hypothetical protein
MEVDGQPFTSCPTASINKREWADAAALYAHYRAGFLPGAGGAWDQDEILLEAIETVSAVIGEIEREKANGK